MDGATSKERLATIPVWDDKLTPPCAGIFLRNPTRRAKNEMHQLFDSGSLVRVWQNRNRDSDRYDMATRGASADLHH